MQLGAISSLVEVGIGLNLAFGVVQQFRDRLSDHLRKVVLAASSELSLELQGFFAQAQLQNNEHVERTVEDADKVYKDFDSFTTRNQDGFVTFAVVASALLIGSLPAISWWNTHPCAGLWLIAASVLGVGPVGSWGFVLICRFLSAKSRLEDLRKVHERDLEAWKKLYKDVGAKKTLVNPKQPTSGPPTAGSSPPPAKPPSNPPPKGIP